ncbi:MAG: response regulator [Defluviitaleaceae bacterium]|nr:response regulator [Defluviitaleaceae bacterium]MCL2837150.1 response regulator [Defluviitaleaceae bacterium]
MKTMLIVDDSEFMRALIKKYTNELDINVIGEADSGKSGVAKYKELMPDIVTMDLTMYEGSGIEALKEIMLINPNAVVIIVSSTAGQSPVVMEALTLGAKGVVDKGSMKTKLAETISKLLGE